MGQLFAVVSALSLGAVMASAANAEEHTIPPPGSWACWAFSTRLDQAWSDASQALRFTIDTVEKAVRYIEFANPNYFEIEEPAGGLAFFPADLARVRAAAAALGHDFNPARWDTEPGETARIYSVDMDVDYAPDLAIERRKNGVDCSDFEFWRTDPSTWLLVPMASPEGWQSCHAEGSGQTEIRFLATFDGMVTVPIRAEGKGLEADFYLYGLKHGLHGASRPNGPGSLGASDDGGLRGPALCRIRLERKVDIESKGPSFCSKFGEVVRSTVFDGSYAIGEPVEGLLRLVQSNSSDLELTWRVVVIDATEAEIRSVLAELGLGPELVEGLSAQFAQSAPIIWVGPRQAESDSIMALIQGVDSSGQVLMRFVQIGKDGVRLGNLPRVWVPSEGVQQKFWPLVYEGRTFLLESHTGGRGNLEIALTPIDAGVPRDEGCRIALGDKGMTATTEYATSGRL